MKHFIEKYFFPTMFLLCLFLTSTGAFAQQTKCENIPQQQNPNASNTRFLGRALGGLFGAALGTRVGNNSGKMVAVSAGMMIGSETGGRIADAMNKPDPQPQPQVNCPVR